MYAENNGVKIWYEVHGRGEPTLIFIQGFQIVHSEQYKRSFVPFLSRHMRVVTMDSRGSGKSDQSSKPAQQSDQSRKGKNRGVAGCQ